MTGKVLLAVEGPVAQVTLSHPGKLNAMSRAMWWALRELFTELQQRSDIGCVVLSGQSGNFCAGGDIAEYPDFRFDEAALRDFHENEVWGALQAMLDCDLPLLAQIGGACMGAGMEIASCCDLRFAGASARFGAPIARLGFPMAPREAALVMRAAGELTAREMLLTAATLDAATLLQRGFLNRVFPDDEVATEARAMAERVVSLAPGAARLNKQCFRALALTGYAQPAPDLIANSFRYAASPEHREGVTAFVEKRVPQFQLQRKP
ncbi:MAG: enoyl-CoA hydratase/isomerase family protein [Polaromonas sp.]|uniref:enoyl-CoA hydratase/isomerase family protein n=1 Tax=Polaromonas sp. TaxID=1869339 RepID=UPI002735DAA2|nr:enoyl-CoA hydratase/isomerase family protein [Polaromonas sp.]MDP3248393.1 enoyl-CoA hydratase/isomerase family protein [Polaromonas sp.]